MSAESGAIPARRPVLFIVDVLVVLLFVVIGRRNHDEAESASGLVHTAAPFLIAVAVAWIALWMSCRSFPTAPVPESRAGGLVVWPATIVLGLILRRTMFGDGTALPFVIVASLFLGLTMNLWRFAAQWFLPQAG